MEKDKKKRILKITTRIVSFIAIIAIAYTYACIVFFPNHGDESNNDYYSIRGFEGEEKNTIDVLAAGSSNTQYGLIPMELYKEKGISTYNNGLSRQSKKVLLELLNESLSYQTPKVLLLDTEILTTEWKNNYANEKSKNNFLNAPYLYHKRWKKLGFDDFSNFSISDKNLYFLLNKGYKITVECAKQTTIGYIDTMANNTTIEQDVVSYFVEPIVTLAKKYGFTIIFVTYPIGAAYPWRNDYAVETIANSYDAKFLDLNKHIADLNLDKEKDFLNSYHLNYYGAKKVSKYLATYLSENYDLTDYRTIPDKNAKMEESLAYYEEETKNL